MTNAVLTVITVVVTNWSQPSIPRSQWLAITEGRTPSERERNGVVEKQKIAIVTSPSGDKKQVVLSKEITGYLHQLGKAKEYVGWYPASSKQVAKIKEGQVERVIVVDKILSARMLKPAKKVVSPKKNIPKEAKKEPEK